MILDDLRKVVYRNEVVALWYLDDIVYRGKFSAIPNNLLHYEVDRVTIEDNRLYINLE